MRDMSQDWPSLINPQLEPSDHMYAILQDHGLDNGGWGPAAVVLKGFKSQTDKAIGPAVYSGNDGMVIDRLAQMTEDLFRLSGKPTIFAKFTNRQDIVRLGDVETD